MLILIFFIFFYLFYFIVLIKNALNKEFFINYLKNNLEFEI